MTRNPAIVALLLLSVLASDATASEQNKPNASQKAKKILLYLDNLGLNHSEVHYAVSEIDARVEDDYFRIGAMKTDYGHLGLYYELEPAISSAQVQLHFQHDNLPLNMMLSPREVYVGYRFQF